VLPHITRLLDAQRLQARLLFANIGAREISLDELRDVDPQLQSLENLNCEQDYLAALYSAGFISTPKGN
jgi:hypothetical protein